jgi:hypothetical protein
MSEPTNGPWQVVPLRQPWASNALAGGHELYTDLRPEPWGDVLIYAAQREPEMHTMRCLAETDDVFGDYYNGMPHIRVTGAIIGIVYVRGHLTPTEAYAENRPYCPMPWFGQRCCLLRDPRIFQEPVRVCVSDLSYPESGVEGVINRMVVWNDSKLGRAIRDAVPLEIWRTRPGHGDAASPVAARASETFPSPRSTCKGS